MSWNPIPSRWPISFTASGIAAEKMLAWARNVDALPLADEIKLAVLPC
jgi:hypothetical protein